MESKYKIKKSIDGAIRIEFTEGYMAVIIPTKGGKNTVCVSCQIGCPVGCKFCYTGKLGFKKNLLAEEIIEQVLISKKILGKNPTTIVFMGMGEPTLNLKQVLLAGEYFHKELKMSLNKITISTSCLKTLKNLIDCKFNVALSLHSPFDNIRKDLIPGAISVDKIIEFANKHLEKSNNKKYIMVEYTMMKNVNDRKEDLEKLISLKWPKKTLFNLIEFNELFPFKKSEDDKLEYFKKEIIKAGWKCFIRRSRGSDISSACGMLEI